MDKTMTQPTILNAIYSRTVYRDVQSGFLICKVLINEKEISVRTNAYDILKSGMSILLVGGRKEDTQYGVQYVDCEIQIDYENRQALIEYLTAIRGVGDNIASELANVFGKSIFEIVNDPRGAERLACISGVTAATASAIVEYIQKTTEERKLFHLLNEYGVKYSTTIKICKRFGKDAIQKIRENPYLCMEMGMSFDICDRIAREKTEIYAYSKSRIMAAIYMILRQGAGKGHTCMPYEDVLPHTRSKLGVSEYDEAIATSVINVCLREGKMKQENNISQIPKESTTDFVEDMDSVYLTKNLIHEVNVAQDIHRLLNTAIPTVCDPDKLCKNAEKEFHVQYADAQRDAFRLITLGGIGIVTGGPGTGKTTVVKGLIAAFEATHPNAIVKLCAPTGRASQRMKEATGRSATTIHRLLDFRVDEGGNFLCKGRFDQIEADLIVVDESSMISIDVADILLSAIKSGTMVLFTGDSDQLPAVGAGNVLHDMIFSKKVPVVALTKTYRQANGSLVIDNAARIRNGVSSLRSGPDFEIITVHSDDEIPEVLKEQYAKYANSKDVFAMQVLAPSRRNKTTGTDAMNNTLQEIALPVKTSEGICFSGHKFVVGDKVMMMRNNYDIGYFNGDVGVITHVFPATNTLKVAVEDLTFELGYDLLEDVVLAYATTIHKSQGSEYNTVIICLPENPSNMLQRNLLYTAVTRAKKKVVIIETERAIAMAISKKDAILRQSKLMDRLSDLPERTVI